MIQQIFVKLQPLLQQVNYIYQHPSHYTSILHKNDGFLHLYDQATMDIVGKTKVIVLDQMKLFAFTNDFNMFYGLRENRFLIFQLSSSQWLAHIPIESGQQSKPYFEAYYLCYYSRKQILICVTTTNFYLVNPTGGAAYKAAPQLKYQDSLIFPQKIAQISGLLWIVGYRNNIYYLKFSQNFDSYQIYDRINTGNIVRLSAQHNPKKQFIYVINDQNEVLLIRVNQRQKKLDVCYKFFHQDYIPHYITLLKLGINTSTTDKFRNRMYICVYCQRKPKQKILQQGQMMIDQIEQVIVNVNKNNCFFIIPTDTQYPTLNQSQQSQQKFNLRIYEQMYLINDIPELKTSPWVNTFNENCLLFLTTRNQVMYINFCSIKQFQLKADQWICMGYKFQMLQKNQVYEERQDQFQDQSEKQQKRITKQFLDDWSQSNLPKNVILNKAYNRIRSLDL